MLAPMRGKAFVGSPGTVGAKIRKLAADFELDEVVINTWAFDPAVRRRSYALLAEEFALPPAWLSREPAVGEPAPDVFHRPVAEARQPPGAERQLDEEEQARRQRHFLPGRGAAPEAEAPAVEDERGEHRLQQVVAERHAAGQGERTKKRAAEGRSSRRRMLAA